MKSDFLLALTQLSAEKNLPKEVVISAVESALVSAYRKDNFAPDQHIVVKLNPANGKVEVWAEKTVVEQAGDRCDEISLTEACQIKPEVQIGEAVMVEATPHNAGRIAAQTAKQVIMQRLHDAEHSAIFEEYLGKEGDIVSGLVQRIEPRQVFVDLGRAQAVLPQAEQVRTERYRVGQRLKVYLVEVAKTSRGPRVIVSRSHPGLLRRLFELEVPEIFNGAVEIKAVAREAGYRSKVAVAAHQEGIDPVGCCVGLRGIRIQNIVGELNGEKLDVVMWDPDDTVFIANALSPAKILNVELDREGEVATVVVPDRQLSLAIGKEGQNVRLAAKLAGWRIDIKSASVAEVEKAEAARSSAGAGEEAVVSEEPPVEMPEVMGAVPVAAGPVAGGASAEEAIESVPFIPPVEVSPEAPGKPQLRFAEDIMVKAPTKPEAKSKKKRKKKSPPPDREGSDGGARPRKVRQVIDVVGDEDEEY
ncbi:MAG TPA: transcription termination/antitermination protein NusA [Dehalococcoidia bacterium]|nr:transcription termination/antitermination protein NusA [Dehalococcoidia bacterium]